tara:strand:+ start:3887 stop:4207 length:321 start_codon:yes stop_codon:yes gene_type:complete
MGKKIKLTQTQIENLVNEASIGFRIPSYPNQAVEELDELINVMAGPITDLRKTKSFEDGDPIIQRIYQLVAEGGELHVKVQELIDLLESLDDKQKQPLGFRTPNNR